jgi:hypothetical protein
VVSGEKGAPEVAIKMNWSGPKIFNKRGEFALLLT